MDSISGEASVAISYCAIGMQIKRAGSSFYLNRHTHTHFSMFTGQKESFKIIVEPPYICPFMTGGRGGGKGATSHHKDV
jgi:hypothetical protein